jgi:squalene synthase HpnC
MTVLRQAQDDIALAAADAYCRALTKGHYENFIVASPFLSAPLRRDLARVYGFCRSTDDFGDESASVEEALERLERWHGDTAAMFAGRTPVHPVLYALRESVARCEIPAEPFFELIEANRVDQRVLRYETWPELIGYCRLSAAPVGRMVLAVFGVTDSRAPALSDDVCIGLQLANHAQDVKRDAAMGRRYLVGEDVAAAGVHGAVRSMVQRARELLESGRKLEALVPPALRWQLALYRLGGTAICNAIRDGGYRTDVERPTVRGRDKVVILMQSAMRSLRPGESGGYARSS